MCVIQVNDKSFWKLIPEAQIKEQVGRVANEINRDYVGEKPVFLSVLNGAFIFAADLIREVSLPCEISFVKVSSYQGTSSTGKIQELIGLNMDIKGRHVVVVEDIIESGLTMKHLLDMLLEQHPASLQVCALLQKPNRLQVELDVKYCCFRIPDDFIVGYGLDYNEEGRNLKDIYSLVK